MRPREGYGIDFGDRFIAVARVERTVAGAPRLEVLESGEGAPGTSEGTNAVAGIAEKIRCRQRRLQAMAAAALPCQDGFVRRIRIPWNSISKARRVLPSLVDAEIPLPIEECQVVFPFLRRSGPREITAWAVVVPRKAVESRLDVLRAAGFEPTFLMFEGLALWQESLRSLARSDEVEHRLVVYAGVDRWAAVGGVGDDMRWTMATRPAPVPEGKAIAETCEAFLRRARAESDLADRPIRWCWCGPALPSRALRAGVERQLGERWIVTFEAHIEPAAFLARALARAALEPGAAAVNLRQDELAHPDWQRWQRRAVLRAIAPSLVASVALVMVHVAALASLRRADRMAQERLRSAALALTGGGAVPYGREVAVARTAAVRRRQVTEPFWNALQTPTVNTVKNLLQAAAADGILLQELQVDERRLSATGTMATPENLARIERALRAQGWQCAHSLRAGGAFTLEGSRP